MLGLKINLDGNGTFEDWKDRKIIHLRDNAPSIRVSVLDRGMTSGKPSVAIGIDIGVNHPLRLANEIRAVPIKYLSADDRMYIIRLIEARPVVIAETSAHLFVSAADAIRGRYGHDLDFRGHPKGHN